MARRRIKPKSIRKQRGGRGRKRFQQGSHGHEVGHHHNVSINHTHTDAGNIWGNPSFQTNQLTPTQYTGSAWSDYPAGGSNLSGMAGSHQHRTVIPGGIQGRQRGGRIRRQNGGRTTPDRTLNLPKPWDK